MLKALKVLGTLFLSLLIIILIIYGYVLFETQIRLKNYPEVLNYKFYLVEDKTNLKDINVGELVIIKENSKISKGDIVLFLNNDNTYSLSRVISNNNVSASLKGDSEESEVLMNNSVIVGKAVKKIKDARTIINVFTNKILLIILAILGLSLVIFSQSKLNKPKQII